MKAIASLVERVPARGWAISMEELTKAGNAAQIMGTTKRGRRSSELYRGASSVADEEDVRRGCLEGLGVLVPEWEGQKEDGLGASPGTEETGYVG